MHRRKKSIRLSLDSSPAAGRGGGILNYSNLHGITVGKVKKFVNLSRKLGRIYRENLKEAQEGLKESKETEETQSEVSFVG